MDKIKALMEKCGLSTEAADAICEAITVHTNAIKESLEVEYAKRTETAKRICIEETEQHKAELARRLQIYCEARSTAIDQIIARQSQAKEGQAVDLLEQVKGLLEGVSVSDDSGMRREVMSLREEVDQLKKERNAAISKANRQTEIAEKVLRRNRLLENKMVSLETEQVTVNESRRQQQSQRIDGGRRSGQPTSTRRTLNENNDRREPIDNRNGANTRTANANSMNNGLTPAEIAASIDVD